MSELKGDYQCDVCGRTEHDPQSYECQRCGGIMCQIITVEDQLRAENAKLREALKELEWSGHSTMYWINDDPQDKQYKIIRGCLSCGNLETDHHAPDCIIGNALRKD